MLSSIEQRLMPNAQRLMLKALQYKGSVEAETAKSIKPNCPAKKKLMPVY